jgi:hypothetical protein
MVASSSLSDVRQVSSLLLSSYNRLSSFCWTRGSKNCVLTSFSYISCYFLILRFSHSFYFLVSLQLSWLHENWIPLSCFLIPWALQGIVLYMHPISGTGHAVSLGVRLLWDPGSRLSTRLFSHSHSLLNVSGANVHWTIALANKAAFILLRGWTQALMVTLQMSLPMWPST